MSKTRRTIGLSAFVMLAVLGTGWPLEKATSPARTHRGGAVGEPAKASDAVTAPVSGERLDLKPAATDSNQESDRSDLILSQGSAAGSEAPLRGESGGSSGEARAAARALKVDVVTAA